MADQPRIYFTLVLAIRIGKDVQIWCFCCSAFLALSQPRQAIERAKRAGKANASSRRVFVTVPTDHFGPILAEQDPIRKMGMLVGDTWDDRLDCRQSGVHHPRDAGTAGQSKFEKSNEALRVTCTYGYPV